LVLQGDLLDPTSLPATLVGISAIIDCATARPEESVSKIDWEGKVALIQCAQVRIAGAHRSTGRTLPTALLPLQAMGISRYVFFSIFNCDKHQEVPLMNIKTCTEKYLKESGVDYTVFRLCGFMQVCRGATCAALCRYLSTPPLRSTCPNGSAPRPPRSSKEFSMHQWTVTSSAHIHAHTHMPTLVSRPA
jgi:hypothetical protein